MRAQAVQRGGRGRARRGRVAGALLVEAQLAAEAGAGGGSPGGRKSVGLDAGRGRPQRGRASAARAAWRAGRRDAPRSARAARKRARTGCGERASEQRTAERPCKRAAEGPARRRPRTAKRHACTRPWQPPSAGLDERCELGATLIFRVDVAPLATAHQRRKRTRVHIAAKEACQQRGSRNASNRCTKASDGSLPRLHQRLTAPRARARAAALRSQPPWSPPWPWLR